MQRVPTRAAKAVSGGVLVLCIVISACAPVTPPSGPPIVEFAGCKEVFIGPRCTIDAGGAIDLWISMDGDVAPSATLGTRVVDLHTEAIAREDGRYLRVAPAALPTTFEVRIGDANNAFVLEIDRAAVSVWEAELGQQLTARNYAAAKQMLERLVAHSSTVERGPIVSKIARVEMREERWSAAAVQLQHAIDAHRASDRLSGVSAQSFILAYLQLTRDEDLLAAEATLHAVGSPIAGDSRSAVLLEISRGAVARRSGQLAAAERHYRVALARALRIGDVANEITARVGLAQSWAEAGQFARALETLEAAAPDRLDGLDVCDAAKFRNTRGWIALLAHESRQAQGDSLPDLNAAAAMLDAHCAYLRLDRSNVRVNIALAQLHRGDPTAAELSLAQARELAAQPPASHLAWMLEIEGRIALARGQSGVAVDIFRNLQERAEQFLLVDAQWRGALGEADALHAGRRNVEAIVALRRADRLLREYVGKLPSSETRALFLARYERVPEQLVALLLDQGEVQQAWQVARHYRNEPLRLIQRLAQIDALDPAHKRAWQDAVSRYRRLQRDLEADAQQEWQLSMEALRAKHVTRDRMRTQLLQMIEEVSTLGGSAIRDFPENEPIAVSGELTLLYFPTPDGWTGFARDDRGLRAVNLDRFDPRDEPAVLSRMLLQPFHAAMDGAARIRVMAYGSLRDLDFHRLPWNGRPLGAAVTVVYSADLPLLAHADLRPERVLLVADPAGDLPAARREAGVVAEIFRAERPPVVIERLQGKQVTPAAMAASLAQATIFHYAGHAAQSGDSDSLVGLELADGQRFELGDVLLLQKVPQIAVLSACSSARSRVSDTGSGAQTLNLAYAFLLRGGEEVVATTRAVNDIDAATLIVAMHRMRSTGMRTDEAMRRAQYELMQAQPLADWAAFRTYTR